MMRHRGGEDRHQRGQLLPRGPGEEQDREGHRHVHEPRSEVGLGDHDHRRQQRQQHDPGRGAALVQPSGTVYRERGERRDQQHLAELRGLDLEERQRDPAVRAADRRHREHDDVQRDDQPVEAVLVFTQARVVQAREHQRERDPDRRRRWPGAGRSRAAGRASRCWSRPCSVTSEHATSPKAASISSGSNSSTTRAWRGRLLGHLDRVTRAPLVIRTRPPRSPRESSGAHSVLDWPGDELAALAEEPLRENLARGRGGRSGAEAALLDGHHDEDRPLRDRARSRRTTTGRPVEALRRAGLAVNRILALRPAAEHVGGGAAGLRGSGVQAGADRVEVLGGDVDVAGRGRVDPLEHGAVGGVGLETDVGTDYGAAVGDRRVGDRQLQRRGLEVALADGEVLVVADRPRTAVGDPAAAVARLARKGPVACSHWTSS